MRKLLILLVCLLFASCGAGGGLAEVEVSSGEGKPEITVPDEDPPEELQTEDLKVGDGAEAKEGDTVTVHYVGVAWSTQEEFDSSWDRGEPAQFPLVRGGLIEGWIEGIPGMKEGGRRLLVIPPDLGYGEQGSPPAIGPDETLVFVVDLVSVGSEEAPAPQPGSEESPGAESPETQPPGAESPAGESPDAEETPGESPAG
jgi:peptidylprolyl isomerase